MTIPDYQTLMRPVLEALADGHEWPVRELRQRVAERLRLSEEEQREMVPSGKKPLFADRLSWAATYLFQAGLLERPRRAVYRITARGTDVLRRHPSRVDNDLLEQYQEFRDFKARSNEGLLSAAE